MAEIFQNYSKLMPEWANESLEEELVKAADEYEAEQKIKHKKPPCSRVTLFCFIILNK